MKIFCIGKNYARHAKEMNSDVPSQPMIFMKPETAINPNDTMDYPPFTEDMHYELEVLLYIGEGGKNIKAEDALNHVSHIGLGIDFTARDIQSRCKEKGHPWEVAKAFDQSACLGPKYDIAGLDLGSLNFRLEKNGETVQDGNTSDMIFKFDMLISYISRFFTLEPGDIIFTGTPEGVGAVNPGDKLIGYLNDELSLKMSINRE